MRQVFVLRASPIRLLNGVLLDEHPSVAAIEQGPDKLVSNIGMVGQRHLSWRKPAHPAECFKAEDCCKVMLPGFHMEAIVLNWRGRRDGMAPSISQPFNRPPVRRLARNLSQTIKDVIEPHLPQTVKQGARIIEHNARLLALAEQLRDEFPNPFVAPVESRRVMVVANSGIVHHVLQVADDSGRLRVPAARWDQGLVHVQRDRGCAADLGKVEAFLGGEYPSFTLLNGLFDQLLGAANVG
jgi:hypothetical protein